jgi:hypothetical protein
MHHAHGIVTQYGIGMGQGHLVLRTRAGTMMDFFVGYPLKMKGARVRDPFPPPDLVIGKTPATVTYWIAAYQGTSVHVTDQVDY